MDKISSGSCWADPMNNRAESPNAAPKRPSVTLPPTLKIV